MSKKDIVIVGARGLGKEIFSYVEEHGGYRIVCFLDEINDQELFGVEVIHPEKYSGSCREAFLAVGYPEYKKMVLNIYREMNFAWQTFIHPSAIISSNAKIGRGVIISPYVLVAGNAKLSDYVFMNAYSTVGHDSIIGERSSLMPYSCATGGVNIGTDCLLATGAKVLPGVSIGERSRVSAGAIVTHNMPADSLISGNPARCQPDVAMLKKNYKK